MTALPEPDPDSEPRLLTVAEHAELGETENGYTGRFTLSDPYDMQIDLESLL